MALYLYGILLRLVDTSQCLFVEPSAGAGAFFLLLPVARRLAFDVDPKIPGIVKQNFLEVTLPAGRSIIVIGNPPFGRNAQLAIDFFNRAAMQADVIAMIFPRTFNKITTINKLDLNFHLVHKEDVIDNAFEFDGEIRSVPTVFQVWERRSVQRMLEPERKEHPDFKFGKPKSAQITIRRIGARAGRVSRDLTLNEASHYFIKVKGPSRIKQVHTILKKLRRQFTRVARNTAGVPSLAQTEIISLYQAWLDAH